jgi:integrase
MGRIYKRGRTWWGDWETQGERHRESLRTRDRAVALERLRERELAPPHHAAHGKTLGTALTYLLETVYAGRAEGTLHCYRTKARHLARLIGADTPCAAIARPRVVQYRATRIAEGAAETTIAKEMIVLRLALREAGIEGVVPRTSAQSEPRTRHLAYDDALALLEELAPPRRVWLMVAVYVGPRASELERLEWSDIDMRRGWIKLRGRKTAGAFRPVPIAPALRPWLEAWAEDAEDGPVLEPWENYRRDLARAVERASSRVGTARIGVRYTKATANDLRRTFASWLVQQGVSTLAVAHLLGHSSTRMVERVYGKLTPAVYEDAVSRLPGCAVFVPDGVPNGARKDDPDAGDEDVSPEILVPRAGIEPATRGFSDRYSLRVVRGDRS